MLPSSASMARALQLLFKPALAWFNRTLLFAIL